jgi:iron complex transport system ATP-binding protein
VVAIRGKKAVAIISLDNISFSYPSNSNKKTSKTSYLSEATTVSPLKIDSLSLSVSKGELVGIIGPNGAGKSTLLRLCAGLLKPDSGVISIAGHPISNYLPNQLAQQLAWLEQISSLSWPLLCEEVVELGLLPYSFSKSETQLRVTNALSRCHATQFAKRSFDSLSQGEQMRVLLARLLNAPCSLLLADEPVASLDLKAQHETLIQLREAASEQAVVIVLHDLMLATRYCTRLILIDGGQKILDGDPKDVVSSSLLVKSFDVNIAWVSHLSFSKKAST